VFDLQLAAAGAELARGRVKLLERLVPAVAEAYAELAGARTPITTSYEAEWASGGLGGQGGLGGDLQAELLDAFASRRQAEVDRGVTLTGPHRDEWRLLVGGMDSRSHASQGEQRTLALALRLGGHRLCGELTGSSPVLLLDDVFSELDDQRAVALVAHLDAGQTLVTTAGTVPRGISADRMLRVDAGVVEEAA
jgi:DNA replication and repair protein RecF